MTKADDTQGNFLSNVAWGLFHLEWATHFYLDNLDQSWALCLTWLPIDGNISQKVAQCIIISLKVSQQAIFSFNRRLIAVQTPRRLG